MASLAVGHHGEIALPADLRERYGLKPATPLRIGETRSGILLVPMTGEPMSTDLSSFTKVLLHACYG
jgi:bifunctional DNA-binding transcriptional regulator/antitoxin component of YhaV-PrlF toxin-antitoxin module